MKLAPLRGVAAALRAVTAAAGCAGVLGLLGLAGCATPAAPPEVASPEATRLMREHPERLIVLAVANPKALPATLPGSTGVPYAASSRYVAGDSARLLLEAVSQEHHLQAIAAWPISGLRLHCVVVEVAPGASRERVLAALAQDARVELAQPLQSFDTLTGAPAGAPPARQTGAQTGPLQETKGRSRGSLTPSGGLTGSGRFGGAQNSVYNDPYIDLQRGFAAIDASGAQQASRGKGVRIALIDTGLDTGHPDLQGVVVASRNFVDADAARFVQDRHGTEVAGIIAAVANNLQGIVGVAPEARLMAYKACWYGRPGDATARCNSFTLAQALMAAIEGGAPIINLSLGGPADDLLSRLVALALRQGRIVVGAVPPQGGLAGFPVGVPGVIAVDSTGAVAAPRGVVTAPGRDILTLVPGAAYDFGSGSSLATAHVSGAAALLLSIDPRLSAAAVRALLQGSPWPVAAAAGEAGAINVCRALAALRGSGVCAPVSATAASAATATAATATTTPTTVTVTEPAPPQARLPQPKTPR